MSDPNRYNIADNQAQRTLGGNILVVDPNGQLVAYDDYARLQAELTDLKSTADRFKAVIGRLLKSGDELDYLLTTKVMSYEVGHASWQWKNAKKAAKDGKPTE